MAERESEPVETRILDEDAQVKQIRSLVKQAFDKFSIVKAMLLSKGLYDKYVENLPVLIVHIQSTQKGRDILEKLGLNELINKS